MKPATLIIKNAKIITMDESNPLTWGVAIQDDRIAAVLSDERDVKKFSDANTQIIDAHQRTIIPGLNDSHIHIIREGLNYAMELRWDTVTSLKDALALLAQQVAKTPPGQWVRVVGGWSEYQFAEKRMPSIQELNEISETVPIFVMHLYERVLLNKAAIKALGDLATLTLKGGTIEKDTDGNPTGVLLASPGASILYSALDRGPHLSYQEQVNSTKNFLRELNRLGVTSAIDAGGGYQHYPENYKVISDLAAQKQLTVRIAYYLFTQRPGHELEDITAWIAQNQLEKGDDYYNLAGIGETLVYSAADYENFFQPRPELPPTMEQELSTVIRLLVKNRWPFRIHATYDESINRILNVLEDINKQIPLNGLRWFLDHAETISEKNIDRVKVLSGGIAIQDRMAYQGEYFVQRYGAEAALHTPPINKMLEKKIPIGAGTDATRVASYNPWNCLYWLISGKTVGGKQLYNKDNILDRMKALELWTAGSAWFSGEHNKKGRIKPGQLADLVILSNDYLSIPQEEIKTLVSVATIVGGKIVYADNEFSPLDTHKP